MTNKEPERVHIQCCKDHGIWVDKDMVWSDPDKVLTEESLAFIMRYGRDPYSSDRYEISCRACNREYIPLAESDWRRRVHCPGSTGPEDDERILMGRMDTNHSCEYCGSYDVIFIIRDLELNYEIHSVCDDNTSTGRSVFQYWRSKMEKNGKKRKIETVEETETAEEIEKK